MSPWRVNAFGCGGKRIRALQERNNVAHSYNREIARGIVKRAKEGFYPLFCELKMRNKNPREMDVNPSPGIL